MLTLIKKQTFLIRIIANNKVITINLSNRKRKKRRNMKKKTLKEKKNMKKKKRNKKEKEI